VISAVWPERSKSCCTVRMELDHCKATNAVRPSDDRPQAISQAISLRHQAARLSLLRPSGSSSEPSREPDRMWGRDPARLASGQLPFCNEAGRPSGDRSLQFHSNLEAIRNGIRPSLLKKPAAVQGASRLWSSATSTLSRIERYSSSTSTASGDFELSAPVEF
jgi:hypothetical protein